MQTSSNGRQIVVYNKIDMRYITKRHIIKIPANISMHYSLDHHVVIFTNSTTRKTFKLKTALIVNKFDKILKVTREPLQSISNNEKKKLKIMQATQVARLKQILLEISVLCCKKLKLIGVGFRVSLLKVSHIDLLYFKLGYSHALYFKIPKNLNFFCLKSNKLFITGRSSVFLTQITALIRSYKTPEPYKGKGILYTTEKIMLKEGKKV